MAFKMKRPMFAGTAAHKSALKHVISMREADKHDHPHEEETVSPKEKPEAVADPGKGRDIAYEGEKSKPVIKGDKELTKPDKKDNKPPKSDYDKAKEKDKDIDKYIRIRDDENASEEERADAQDKINEAYGKGPTDRGDKVRKKKEEEKKADSSKPTEKADTSKDTKTDKIAKGEKPEGTEKASGRMKPGDPGYMKLPESEKLKIQRAAKERHKKALDAWRKGGKEGKRPKRKDYY
jgi:hypothetical protein